MEQITRPAAFEPAHSDRRFTIHLLETAYALTFPPLMPVLLSQAPNMRLHTQTWSLESVDKLLDCEIDLGIAVMEKDSRSAIHVSRVPSELNYVELMSDYPVFWFVRAPGIE